MILDLVVVVVLGLDFWRVAMISSSTRMAMSKRFQNAGSCIAVIFSAVGTICGDASEDGLDYSIFLSVEVVRLCIGIDVIVCSLELTKLQNGRNV